MSADLSKLAIDYLTKRANDAERLAIEAYKIIESLVDDHECDLQQGSTDAGLYCMTHGYFQNDMPDGKCPQRLATEWLERNEKLGTSD